MVIVADRNQEVAEVAKFIIPLAWANFHEDESFHIHHDGATNQVDINSIRDLNNVIPMPLSINEGTMVIDKIGEATLDTINLDKIHFIDIEYARCFIIFFNDGPLSQLNFQRIAAVNNEHSDQLVFMDFHQSNDWNALHSCKYFLLSAYLIY